jgi:uncharacterized protein
MGQEIIIMNIAVFGAAALQSATGIGFGIVAGPIMLMVMGSSEAIQISVILNILIAGFLVPSIKAESNHAVLSKFLWGSAIGIPVGLYVFMSVDIGLLKMLAGLAVSLTVLFVIRSARAPTSENHIIAPTRGALPIGVVSGLMGGSLGMPGPVPAAWMSTAGYSKTTVRATILMLFVFSYSAVFLLQVPLAGLRAETIHTSALLAPATIIGILFGRKLAHWLTEQTFRWLLVMILVATAFLLFSSVL